MGQSKEAFGEMRQAESAEETQPKPSTGLTLSTAKFLDLDKGSIKDLAMNIVDDYQDGFKSPAELLLISKKLTDFAEQIKENIKGAAASELKLSSGEKASVHGATVTEQMTGVRWDFSACGDKLYDEAMKVVKEREAFLKTVKGQQMTGDLSTGETWLVSEPVKSGSMSLIFKY
jgi:hypothetical protein